MPTKRFENLPDDKRQRITEAAIDELAEKGLDGATVAGIIERAEIPRGSFYQYFESMDDLIDYIMELIRQAKFAYLGEIMGQVEKMPFLDFYREGFHKGLQFAYDYPKFLAIGSHFYSSKGKKVIEITQKVKNDGIAFYTRLIEGDKRKGLVRADIDSRLVAGLMLRLSSENMLEQLYRDHKSPDEIMGEIDKVVEIIKYGILIKGRENNV